MVRLTNPEDASAVAELYLDARHKHVAFAPLAHTEDEVRSWIKETLLPRGGSYVCVEDTMVVGFISVSKRGEVGWIDQLYVAPGHLRAGHGSRLVAVAKKILASPIRLYTFQQNVAARKFYEREGFRSLEFSDGSENEEHCPDILMEWVGPDA